MRRLLQTFVCLLLVVATACSHADLWEELNPQITSFINQYFPDSELNAVTKTGGTTYVRLTDGPGLTFGSDNKWTDLQGYGMPMPQVLLYDQLPQPLYTYLEATEQLNDVFVVQRDQAAYTLTLLKTSVKYDISTHHITQLPLPTD